MNTKPDFQKLRFDAAKVFTPSAPIRESDLFHGRSPQIGNILDAISQPGAHAILYGERGVGKTSLSNVLSSFVAKHSTSFVMPKVNCVADDTYTSIWRKLLEQISITERRDGVGFAPKQIELHKTAIEGLPKRLTPDDVRKVLSELSRGIILVLTFDEFDRIRDQSVRVQMADTIKMLSDYDIEATILVIGVADSVVDLVGEHLSIERALVQVPMPRMSPKEIEKIITTGLGRLGMLWTESALSEIKDFSQGLPHIAHLLGLHVARTALVMKQLVVDSVHVEGGVKSALQHWDQSVKSSYYAAVSSPQPGHIFREVLLACALTQSDEFGYFAPADVRSPLRVIKGKQYNIANFSRHLTELTDVTRGQMLTKIGASRKFRFRFASPLMRPYVIMRSYGDGMISKEMLQTIARARGRA